MFKKKLTNLADALGLESDDTYLNDVEVTETPEVTASEADGEADAVMSDASATMDTAESLIDDGVTLEKVGDVVDSSLENGEGVSGETAAVVEETIENILRRHGMKRHIRIRKISSESFNTNAGRLDAAKQLKVSIEGIFGMVKDGIGAIFGTVSDFFGALWKTMKAWETNMLASFVKLKELASKLTKTSGDSIAIHNSKNLPIANKEMTLEDLSSFFEKSVKQIKSPTGLEHNVNNFIKKFEEEKEYSKDKDLYYSKEKMEELDKLIRRDKLQSYFVPGGLDTSDKSGKDVGQEGELRIKPCDGRDIQEACFPAIDLLKLKPIKQLEKISDGFLTHMIKSAKSWVTSDKGSGRKDAEGALKFKKEGQMTSVKEVYSKINSAYKYIMYENIKTYKETVNNYYKILNEVLSKARLTGL